MTVVALLNDLQACGIELQADGERLRFRPRERMSAAMLDQLRVHKPKLLAWLAGELKPTNIEQRTTRADREAERFTRDSVPWPDGGGRYDPSNLTDEAGRGYLAWRNESRESTDSAENIGLLQAKTFNPMGLPQWVGPLPTLYDRPDGGKETFIERAARYRQECNGLPPGASQPNGRFRLIDNTSAQAATGEADADKTLAEACSDDIDADKTPADSFEMGFCQLSVLSVTEEPPDKS